MATVTTQGHDPRLARWEANTRWVIVLAALFPLIGSITTDGRTHTGQVAIDTVAWLVFLVDFVVHLRWQRHYLRTWRGWVVLTIVLVTFPWYLIPAFRGPAFLVLARLAGLARILIVAFKGGVVTMIGRLGKTAVFGLVLVFSSAIVVQRVEQASAGFDSFGDSLWWAIVTMTTVGYGDLVPTTSTGRIAASILMIGGIGVIGSTAAVMASFLRGEDVSEEATASTAEKKPEVNLSDVAERLDQLDRKVDALLSEAGRERGRG